MCARVSSVSVARAEIQAKPVYLAPGSWRVARCARIKAGPTDREPTPERQSHLCVSGGRECDCCEESEEGLATGRRLSPRVGRPHYATGSRSVASWQECH